MIALAILQLFISLSSFLYLASSPFYLFLVAVLLFAFAPVQTAFASHLSTSPRSGTQS